MQVGRTWGSDKVHRPNHACFNIACPRERDYKSIRGNLVFNEIDRVIKEKLLSLPDNAYDEYLKKIKFYSDTAKTKLCSDLSRAGTAKAGYEKKLAELSPSLLIINYARTLQTMTEQIGEASQIVQQHGQLIAKHQRSIERSTLPAIDKDEFRATLKEMAEKLKAADVVQRDIIVSNLF